MSPAWVEGAVWGDGGQRLGGPDQVRTHHETRTPG